MNRPRGLQFRLAVTLSLFVLAVWLAATVTSGIVARHELDEAYDSALQEAAQRLLSLAVVDIFEHEDPAGPMRIGALQPHDEYLTYMVRDDSGAILLQSHGADPAVFPEAVWTGFRDTQSHRIYGEAAVSNTIFIAVAEPLAHRREAALEVTLALLGPLPLLMLLSLLGVWLIVRRNLRPLRGLRHQIEARDKGDLSPVTADRLPADIAPIAQSVNRLLERLRRALDAERSFAANCAHELRTPVAGALAQTQRLIAETPAGPLNTRARDIETALRRLSDLSARLLQLARAEAGRGMADREHDLLPVIAHVIDEAGRSFGGGSAIRIDRGDIGALPARIEPDAFAILLRNLIENALSHGPQGGVVAVGIRDRAIHVVNGGPTVPPAVLERLKGRFERGPTNASGSGLGLAIAEAMAVSMGATLELHSPASGRNDGFEAVVRLSPP